MNSNVCQKKNENQALHHQSSSKLVIKSTAQNLPIETFSKTEDLVSCFKKINLNIKLFDKEAPVDAKPLLNITTNLTNIKKKAGMKTLSTNVLGYLSDFFNPKDLINYSKLNKKFLNKFKNEASFKMITSIINKKRSLDDLLANDASLLSYYIDKLNSENEFTLEYINQIVEFVLNYCLKNQKFALKTQNNIGSKGFYYLSLANLSGFNRIDISKNKIGDEGANKLACILPFLNKLEYLNVSMNQISGGGIAKIFDALQSTHSIIEINISGNNLQNTGMESAAALLEANFSLKSLNFSYNGIVDDGVKLLTEGILKSKSLTSIDLSFNKITDASLNYFLRLFYKRPELQHSNDIKERKLHKKFTISEIKSKTSLSYSQEGLASTTAYPNENIISKASESVKKLLFIPSITARHQTTNIIKQSLLEDEPESKSFEIHSLNISSNKFGNAALISFFGSLSDNQQHTITLKKLNVSSTNIDQSVLPSLSAFIELSSLNEVRLRSNNMSNNSTNGAVFAKAVRNSQSIRILNLDNCLLGDIMINNILKNLEFSSLTDLNLNNNSMSSKAFLDLPQLHKLPKLKFLSVSNNNLGNEGIEAITKYVLTISTLTTLKISMVEMDDDGLSCLVINLSDSNLVELDVSANNCTDDSGKLLFDFLSAPTSKLEVLNAAGMFTNEIVPSIINCLEKGKSLKKLDLSESQMKSTDLQKILTSSKLNSSLVYLNLGKILTKNSNARRLVKEKDNEIEVLIAEILKSRDFKIMI